MHRWAKLPGSATTMLIGLGLLAAAFCGTTVANASPGVCAFVFIDANGNGDYEVGEEEALDVDVCLRGLDGGEVCKRTDDQGAACWVLIPKGDYQVCVETSENYVNTTAVCKGVGVNAERIEQVLFGIKLMPRAGDHEEEGGLEQTP